MAPEYLVRGQLTEMTDVYAFGVLVIEIASGRKNNVFSESSTSVLHTVGFIFLFHVKVSSFRQSQVSYNYDI